MKEYTKKTMDKLTELFKLYPDAELKFGGLGSICMSKVLSSDIKYNSETNTIYIG